MKRKKRRIIVEVAPVGSNLPEGSRSPIRPREVAEEVIACAEKGASLVHLHVRDTEGKECSDLSAFSETLTSVRERSSIIIQGSTGSAGGKRVATAEERCIAIEENLVEEASLNMGSVNFPDNTVYVNTPQDIRFWADRMHERGIRPEMQIFDFSMLDTAVRISSEFNLQKPLLLSCCFGIDNALPAEARYLAALIGLLPEGCRWGVVHHGMRDLSFLAAAVGLGAHWIRVGFEDSPYYAEGQAAENNLWLVTRAVECIRAMGFEPASAEEAREILDV